MQAKDKEFLFLAGGSVLAVLGIAYVLSKLGEPQPQATSGPHGHHGHGHGHHGHHGGRGRGWGGWGGGWGWDYPYPYAYPPLEIVDSNSAVEWDPVQQKWVLKAGRPVLVSR